jgi:type IV pilus assembly protein PilB
MARLDIAERRVPQDGRIKMRLSKNRAIDFRVSTCPTLFGEKVVTRILDPSSAMLGIDALGYEPVQRELYLKYLAKPQGMILVTGPTGSGKTVSLYTGLNILNTEDTNISTAEDPAEINLPGVNQVNVNNKVGLTFAAALRAFLRQDPDVIMVGEVRDKETAEIAVKAALTGHLVISTLHTNDAPATIIRLVDMGIDPMYVGTSVLVVCSQKLLRRVCKDCGETYTPSDEELHQAGMGREFLEGGNFRRPKGCPTCVNTGYKGRTAVHEVVGINAAVRKAIFDKKNLKELKTVCMENGMQTMRQVALNDWKRGLTSLHEVLNETAADR